MASSSDEESYSLIDGSNESDVSDIQSNEGEEIDIDDLPLVKQLREELQESKEEINKMTTLLSLSAAEVEHTRASNKVMRNQMTKAVERIEKAEAELKARLELIEADKEAESARNNASEKELEELKAENLRLEAMVLKERIKAANQQVQYKRHLEAVETELAETMEKSSKELKAATDRVTELRKLVIKYKAEAEAASLSREDDIIDRLTRVNEENVKTIANLVELVKNNAKSEGFVQMEDVVEKMTTENERLTLQLRKEQSTLKDRDDEIGQLKIINEMLTKQLENADVIPTTAVPPIMTECPVDSQNHADISTANNSPDDTEPSSVDRTWSHRLAVGNIPYYCDEDELMDFLNRQLSRIGLARPIIACEIDPDTSSAFIDLRSEVDVILALALDGIPYMDEKLVIQRPAECIQTSADFETNAPVAPVPNEDAQSSITDPLPESEEVQMAPLEIAQTISHDSTLPSCVLRLENLITAEELADGYDYDDLVCQILELCDQYGIVRSLDTLHPRMDLHGKVYIEFERAANCEKARDAIHGMLVADRSIVASYYDEQKYRKCEWS